MVAFAERHGLYSAQLLGKGVKPRGPGRMSAGVLIVQFLGAVKEARIGRIVRYMETSPYATPPATTRNRISKLVSAGRIERVCRGRYRRLEE